MKTDFNAPTTTDLNDMRVNDFPLVVIPLTDSQKLYQQKESSENLYLGGHDLPSITYLITPEQLSIIPDKIVFNFNEFNIDHDISTQEKYKLLGAIRRHDSESTEVKIDDYTSLALEGNNLKISSFLTVPNNPDDSCEFLVHLCDAHYKQRHNELSVDAAISKSVSVTNDVTDIKLSNLDINSILKKEMLYSKDEPEKNNFLKL